MAQTSIIEQIEALIEPIIVEMGLELVDIEYRREERGWVLRLFVDKEGGVTLDDCAHVSRQASALFDVEEPIKTAYFLEVSSPGVERPLKKEADFIRFSGQLAQIKTIAPLDLPGCGKARKTFVGTLQGVAAGRVRIQLEEGGKEPVEIDLTEIASARLEFRF